MNFIRKYKFIILIFLLALGLRIYKLGTFPVGFHVDEVKVGWNALSILKTGKDDWGNRLALYYNSFGDFRPRTRPVSASILLLKKQPLQLHSSRLRLMNTLLTAAPFRA